MKVLVWIVLGLVAYASDAHAGGIKPGEYSVRFKAVVAADSGGQDCAPSESRGTFSFGVDAVGGAYVLIPRTGFPLSAVVPLAQSGLSLAGEVDATSIFLAFKGKQVTGTITTDQRCTPIYYFKGTWRGRPRPAPVPLCTSDPATCGGETVCVNSQCVAAFGREYVITIADAAIPVAKPDGSAWDPDGSAPDPFAVLSLNGRALGTTTAVQDSLLPVWRQTTAPTVIPAGVSMRLDVVDKDAVSDDGILTCTWELTADLLHAGFARCSGPIGGAVIMFSAQ